MSGKEEELKEVEEQKERVKTRLLCAHEAVNSRPGHAGMGGCP